jgi:predicted thioesterase
MPENIPDIPIGAEGRYSLEVTTDIAISFLGNDRARVLATPWLIAYLEMTSRDTVKAYLLDGFDTVGTQVTVSHLAATPMGMRAHFYARIVAVSGKRVTFHVEAFDDKDKIAEGTHERAIIDVAKFADRVQQKLRAAPSQ